MIEQVEPVPSTVSTENLNPENPPESNQEGAATLEEALTLTGWGKFNYITIAVGGFSVFSALIGLVDISFVLPECKEEFQMDQVHFSILSVAFFVGTIFSCHVWGFLTDVKGRRYVLLRSLFPNFFLYTMASVTPGYTTFLLFRLCSGLIACGANVAGFPYLAEMQPIRHRTTALLTGNILVPGCFIYAAALAMAIIPMSTVPHLGGSWRLYYFMCGVPSFLTWTAIFYLPESPKFLAVTGHPELAIETLRTIHRCNEGKQEVYNVSKIIVLDYQRSSRDVPRLTINVFYIAKQICYQTMDLFKKPHVWNTCKGTVFSFTIFLSLGFVLIWLPKISKLMTTHNSKNDLTVCSVLTSFGDAVSNDKQIIYSAYLGVLFACVLQVVFFCIIIFLNWIGLNLKLLVSLYLFICCVSTLLVIWVSDKYFAILLVGNIVIFGGSAFNSIISIFIQAFPTHTRGMAVCLLVISVRLGSIFGNLVMPLVLFKNCPLVFFVFSFSYVVCAVLFISFRYATQESTQPELNSALSSNERTV